MQTVVEYTCLGMWLSWLARFAHIEEVGGSSLHPHQTQRHPAGASVFGYVYGTRSGGNGAAALVPKTRGCCICPKTTPGSSQCVVRVFAYT